MAAMLKHPAGQFALLLLAALIWRCDTFGDPSLHDDEVFYHAVGVAMHQGALPYVDVWDRKPFGLFALYWLITAVSFAPIAYQLAATLAAATAGWAVARLAQHWSTWQAGLLAGLAYILWLAPLQGYGGQTPVFYNPFIALAALLVVGALPALRNGEAPRAVAWAMLLAGLGITIKTTALFEGAFLGLFAAIALSRSPLGPKRSLRPVAVWITAGALPSLAIAAAYWGMGHWHEYWQAMVTSNLTKPADLYTGWIRLRLMYLALAPLLALAAFGLLNLPGDARRFLLLWLGAAFLSLLAVANFYLHYALPLLVPLCVAAAGFLTRRIAGPAALLAMAAYSFWIEPPFRFEHTRKSQAAMTALVQTVQTHAAGRGLLTFEGPTQLYRLTGKPFITPLVFTMHLSALIEKDVSHLSTLNEMQRALAQRPGVVVMSDPIINGPVNPETEALVRGYVTANCRFIGKQTILQRGQTIDLAVWGDCGV